MPSRPDIRELASNVRDAFSEMDREALLDVLSFVLKEYVVEGPPPMLVHQAETLSDLQGASFAQLISQMQTRFDFPELAMFVVDGDQVSVRVGGVVQPLLAQRQPLGEPTGRTQAPPPQPGVRIVETTLAQRPPAPAAAPQAPAQYIDTRPAASAPPPSRGISVRGAPTGGGGGASPAQPAAPAPAPTPAAPAAAAAPEKSDKPEGSGDDASARFSLLELD